MSKMALFTPALIFIHVTTAHEVAIELDVITEMALIQAAKNLL